MKLNWNVYVEILEKDVSARTFVPDAFKPDPDTQVISGTMGQIVS